ncbi:MAG: hypothetical protein OEW75_03760 [Cyclobacteriaceae bacterium]|nr:hypothetical protein [Cyclobacteriaceae bacterium]
MLIGRKLCVLLVSWLSVFSLSYAQEGDYYIKRFVVEEDRIDNPYFSILQSDDGYILVSNRSGVLQYDGYRWERIPCPGAVYSMDKGNGNFIVSGKFGFGYIDTDNSFISLSDSIPNVPHTFSCKLFENKAVFQTDSILFVYDLNDHKLIKEIKPEFGSFLYLIEYDDQILAITDTDDPYQVTSENRLVYFGDFEDISGRPVFFEKFGNKTLIGSNENMLFLDENNEVKPLFIDDEGYLNNNIITSGKWLNEQLIAIGTLKGGIAFINPNTGKLIQIANSHTGLSDNEILGMILDKDQGLWVTESNGLDRIAPFLPIKNFSNYPGLNGRVVSVFPDHGKLYISTTLGVYLLNEVKDYSEIVKIIQKPGVERSSLPSKSQLSSSKEDTTQKKKFFNFLKKDKREDVEDSNRGLLTRMFGKTESENDSVIFEEKISLELKSIRYLFQKVQGIDSRNSLFEKKHNHLINGGLSGIYEIFGDSSILITNEPVRDIMITNGGFLVATNLEGEVLFYRSNGVKWTLFERINEFSDHINYLYEDVDETIWMTGNTGIYKIYREENNYLLSDYTLVNPYSDKTLVVEISGKIYFINPTGYYYYDKAKDQVLKDSLLSDRIGLPVKYFGFDEKSSWVNTGEYWYGFSHNDDLDGDLDKTLILSLIRNIKYISFDEENNVYWVLTDDDLIYSVNNISNQITSNYGLKLKEVRQPENLIDTKGRIIDIDEQNGSVTFEYVHPDYSGALGIKYRYKLDGLENEWSDWSENNLIKFPYLPPGKYTILVQSKDIFGQLNESEPLLFNIIPPYWEQLWFYAFEVILFAFLLFISIRLNRSPKSKFLILNRLLAFLTLILIVEYLQAIGDAKLGSGSSPVIGFFIQVVIAAAVLPLEQVMRKWLIGETRVSDNIKEIKKESE